MFQVFDDFCVRACHVFERRTTKFIECEGETQRKSKRPIEHFDAIFCSSIWFFASDASLSNLGYHVSTAFASLPYRSAPNTICSAELATYFGFELRAAVIAPTNIPRPFCIFGKSFCTNGTYTRSLSVGVLYWTVR